MKKRKFNDGGIYTADMGKPPQDIDGGSAPMKRPKPPMAMKKPMPKKPMPMAPKPRSVPPEAPMMPGMKKGGAVKGKTKGAQVKMKSGGKC